MAHFLRQPVKVGLTRKWMIRHEDARTVQIDLTDKARELVEKLIPIAMKFEKVGVKNFSRNRWNGCVKALGLTVPNTLIGRADEVIE